MIAGGSATLAVSDLDRAVRFYVETLGFKLLSRSDARGAEVDAGGGLVLALQVARGDGAKPGARGSISVGLALNQPIADVVEVLANRGVTFEGGVRDEGGAKVARFGDPDGNALYLVEAGGGAGS